MAAIIRTTMLTCALASQRPVPRRQAAHGGGCVRMALVAGRTQVGTLAVSPLGTGTLNWPLSKREDEDSAAALRACLESGVNLFDTAELCAHCP